MRNSELDSDLSNIDISDIRETSRPSRGGSSRGGQGAGRRRRRRKKRRRVLSKLLPPLIAIALIAVVVVVAMRTGLFESFSYSTKEADLFEYFGITGTDEAVLIVDGEPTEGRMRVINGTLYMPLSDIKALYTDRFYYEIAENRLLYTMEQETYSTVVGEASYNNASGTVTTDYVPVIEEPGEEESVMYMALDYLKLFKNISVRLFGGGNEPYRAEIKTEWGDISTAPVTKDHSLRRGQDKKSDIITALNEGDTVRVIGQEGEWTKVTTEELITGYAETRYLGQVTESPETPVTDVAPEQFTSLTSDSPIVLMWHSIGGIAGNDTVYSAIEGTKGYNVISPTWFSVESEDGSIRSMASHDYVDAAHSKGLKVWAAVDDFNSNTQLPMYGILTNPASRAHIISDLMRYAAEYALDGINVDFERIGNDSGEAFIQFIRELCIEGHKNNLVISVDNYVPKTYNSYYHRKEQGVFADYVIIMGYDETFAGSQKAGSVASIGFVREGIEETLKDVPANKVINALPFYTRVWEETPKTDAEIAASDTQGEYVPYTLSVLATPSLKQEDELLANYHATPVWDETSMQNYATWTSGGKTYEVWLEDAASLTAKLEFMKAFELGGAAGWEITLAAPYVWDLLEQYY